ncbi:MAG: hypothetical protein ACK5JM_03300 [Rhodoblastus sp.]
MAGVKDFIRNTNGGLVERVAIMAGAIALASIGGAHFLDVASRDTNSKLYALFQTKPGIDYTATATFKKQAERNVIDPCAVRAK